MRNPGENAGGRRPGRRRGPAGRSVSPRQGRGPDDTGPGEPAPSRGPTREPSLFTPGYSAGRGSGGRGGQNHVGGARADTGQYAAGRYGSGPYSAGQYGVGEHGSAGSTAGKGPIRGFPPAPGQPPPRYPPGQFSAWNRAAWPGDNGYEAGSLGPDSGAWLAVDRGTPGDAGPGPAGAEPGYRDAGYADAGYPDAGYPDADYSALAVSDPAADVTSTQAWEAVDDDRAPSGWPDPDGPGQRGRYADTYPGRTPPGAHDGAGPPAPEQAIPRQAAASGAAPPRGAADRRAQPDSQEDPLPARRTARRGGRPVTATRPTREPVRGQPSRGRGSRGRARPRGRKRRGRVLLAIGLTVAIAAGAASYLWFSGRLQALHAAAPNQAGPKRSAARPSPSHSPGVLDHIVSRALDPKPLTLAELFPAHFTDGGVTYTRTVERARARCAVALIGSALVSAVSKGKCTQVLRASYLSSRKLMGTIGVLNLSTLAAAKKAGKAAGPADFIAQLPAARGPTKRLAQGTGVEAAEVKGHYLVLVWAEFTNLRAPKSAAQEAELAGFIRVLFEKTANVSLAIRMVTGRPPL